MTTNERISFAYHVTWSHSQEGRMAFCIQDAYAVRLTYIEWDRSTAHPAQLRSFPPLSLTFPHFLPHA